MFDTLSTDAAATYGYFNSWFHNGYYMGCNPVSVMGFSMTPFLGFIDLTTGLCKGRTNDGPEPTVDQIIQWAAEANQ